MNGWRGSSSNFCLHYSLFEFMVMIPTQYQPCDALTNLRSRMNGDKVRKGVDIPWLALTFVGLGPLNISSYLLNFPV